MNTREREVMDALAEALRGVHPNPGLSTTLSAYDALLAEGSASSEGAEAVAPFAQVHEIVATYTNPQPAQGEHEQRSCEGSDDGEAQRARSWLAVVAVLNEVAPTWHRDSAGTGCEKVCAAIRALARRTSERRPIADEVVGKFSVALQRKYYEQGGQAEFVEPWLRAAIRAAFEQYESALPRGLPAGSDALDAASFAWVLEKDSPEGVCYATIPDGMGFAWSAPGDHANAFRMARREDADNLAQIMDDADRCAEHGWHNWPLTDAAIAAQQRQGGGA